jgi:AcrR family transcriptional regulator
VAVSQNGLIVDEMSDRIIEVTERIAMTNGAHTVNVRKILLELGITNRVFYNRFRNVEDVLDIVYQRVSEQIRTNVTWESDSQEEFFERVTDMVANTLIRSYDLKKQFNQYMFENDSRSHSNYEWWMSNIKEMLIYAKEKGYVRADADVDMLNYSLWCFWRGFNADAVGRGIPKGEAIKNCKYSFGIILDGLRANPKEVITAS